MKEIKVGIVGFGFMGRAHTYGYKTLPLYYRDLPFKITLRAVADPVPGVAARAAEELGFTYATQNPGDVFADPEIDIVDICTPNIYHKEGIIRALAAGKHVYCDKPLGMNPEEAREMAVQAARARGVSQMTLQYRFVPAIRRARQLIESGFLGRPVQFRAAYLHSGYIDPQRPFSWRLDRARSGGGAVMDLGVHAIDLVRLLLGEFRTVSCLQRTFIRQRPRPEGDAQATVDVDDVTLAQAELANGAVGTLEFSRLATGAEDELRLELYGEKGGLRFSLMEPDWLYAYDARGSDQPLGGSRGWQQLAVLGRYPEKGALPGAKCTQGWTRFHIASAYDLLSNVVRGELGSYSPSFGDGLAAQAVVAALQRSADAQGAWTEVAPTP